jgi:hypothetical protein
VVSTAHPRISVVRPRRKPLKEMDAVVRQLEHLAIEGLVDEMLHKVAEVIPSYTGQRDANGSWVLQPGAPRKPLATAAGNRADDPARVPAVKVAVAASN